MPQYRVTGVIRLRPKRPDARHEQVPVRQTVKAISHGMAFALVRQAYQERMADSDLTAEEVRGE
jgi:hypothetical protein